MTIAAAVIVLVAVGAIVSMWTVFSPVADEPAHVAAGVEWLDRGTYVVDRQHPPLARILEGIGPMARGATYEEKRHWLFAGNAILYGNGDLRTTLASARAGNLPFFLLACAVVFFWTRRWAGHVAALAALILFATQPSVLAHAALATTDMAACATIIAALFAFDVWLDRPRASTAALLGLAVATALASKFSAIAFLPAGFVAVLLVRRPRLVKEHGSAALAAVVAIAGVLAVYRFHGGFLEGIEELRAHNAQGHPSYLFGEVRRGGWWYYFPVAIWFKTTLPLLAAFAFGTYVLIRKRTASLVPLAAFAAILAVGMLSRISIGVRHVLPLYPLMAMVGAFGLVQLRKPVLVAMLAAQIAVAAFAHPDHLAYFNITAGRDPSRILLDSNLDWGQDLFRLEDACRRHHIDAMHIAWFGSADLRRHALPRLQPLQPFTPVKGWIAISEMQLKDIGARNRPRGAYDWLLRYEPVERVGKSMLLYRID